MTFQVHQGMYSNFYSDAEIKRLNEHIFKMDEQICRALIIHQLLGTRISDTLTLKTDCLSMRNNRYFIRIDQVKSVTYEKAISEEVAQLIMKAIDYTKERYGETTYIFVKKDDPTRPYQYSMIQNQIMTMIRQEDIRDDNGEFLKFGNPYFPALLWKKIDRNACGRLDDSQVTGAYLYIFGTPLSENRK